MGKVAEDELLSQEEVAKEAILKLEQEMTHQQQQHLSSTETSKEILKDMEVKQGVTEKELNDIKVKCVQNEEKLDENEKELIRLRKEREHNEVEMEEKMKVISIRENELNDIRKYWKHWDNKTKEQLETVNALRTKNGSLEDKISHMRLVMDSTTGGLQKERLNNDIKDSTIDELNKKVCRITEQKMRMKIENDKNIADLELSKKVAEEKVLSQGAVSKDAIRNLEEKISPQKR